MDQIVEVSIAGLTCYQPGQRVVWTEFSCGGHFAAMEVLFDDVRTFFRQLR